MTLLLNTEGSCRLLNPQKYFVNYRVRLSLVASHVAGNTVDI